MPIDSESTVKQHHPKRVNGPDAGLLEHRCITDEASPSLFQIGRAMLERLRRAVRSTPTCTAAVALGSAFALVETAPG
jgi:hypothetical protein